MRFLFFVIILSLNSCDSGLENKKTDFDTERKKDLSKPNKELTGKIDTLDLEYTVWGCACAPWKVLNETGEWNLDTIFPKTIFIEPEDGSLKIPDPIDLLQINIRVIGEYYTTLDYPKDTPETEEELQKARVFRYTSIDFFEKDSFDLETK